MSGGFICHDAWQEIPSSALVELLDTVRNLTLNMALGIKDELGTGYTDLRRVASGKFPEIQNIIFQNIGGNANVAFGQGSAHASSQSETVINVGDREALDVALTKVGLKQGDLESLTEATQGDGKKPGNKVGAWVKENASKVIAGGMRVGSKIGTELLTAWIKQHYGI